MYSGFFLSWVAQMRRISPRSRPAPSTANLASSLLLDHRPTSPLADPAASRKPEPVRLSANVPLREPRTIGVSMKRLMATFFNCPVVFVTAGFLVALTLILASRSPVAVFTSACLKSRTLSRSVPLSVRALMPIGASVTFAATKLMSAFTAARRVKSMRASGIRRADRPYTCLAFTCSAFSVSPFPVPTGIPNTTPRSSKSSCLDVRSTISIGFF